MPTSPALHPDPELLAAYARGLLPETETTAVEDHIETCPVCAARLDVAAPDPFLSALRDAAKLNAASAVDSPTALFLGGAPTVRDEVALPAELAAHPRYRLGELLGRGGMGAVYKAEHTLMERPVAVKVIAPHLLRQAGAVDRFRQEVKAAARLSHPNIVTAFDAEQVGPVTVLVMEYVEGRSLSDVLRAGGPLPVLEACGYARQAALGLAHAHALGMVHRDVKPHNLMLTPDGRVKILDFGLARFVAEGLAADAAETLPATPAPDAGHALTHTGACMGTPDYMAPEQARDARAADARADVYALGCTLYHLLAGRVPFPGGSNHDKLARLDTADPTPLAELCPAAPPGLAAVVAKMMAKRPDDRYPTAAEVADALARFTKPLAASRGKRLVLALTSLVLLLTAAGVVKIATDRGKVVPETGDVPQPMVERGPVPPEVFRTAWAGTERFSGFEFSPDGRELFAARASGEGGRVYDLNTGRVRLKLIWATACRYVPGRPEMLTPFDGMVKAVDTRTGGFVGEMDHLEYVLSLHLAPDGATALTTTDKGTTRLWGVDSRKLLKEWKDRVAYFSPVRGELLLARGDSAPDAIWDIAAGRERPAPEAYRRFGSLAHGVSERFGPERVATWSGQTLSVFNRADGTLLHTLDLGAAMDRRQHRTLGVGPGGRFVVHTAEDITTAVVREVATGKELARLPLGGIDAVYQAAVSADGKRVAVANTRGDIAVWDLSGAPAVPKVAPTSVIPPTLAAFGADAPLAHGLAVSPDGRYAVSVGGLDADASRTARDFHLASDRAPRLWDLATGKEVGRFTDGAGHALSVCFSPDGTKIAVALPHARVVRVWDVKTQRLLLTLEEHAKEVFGVAWSPDGTRIASAGWDRAIRVSDAHTGKQLQVFGIGEADWGRVAFAPEGGGLFAGGLSGSALSGLTRFDPTTTKRDRSYDAPYSHNRVSALAVSPDGRWVVAAHSLDTIHLDVPDLDALRLWDAETCRFVRRLGGHRDAVSAAAFTPDGAAVVSVGFDGFLRVWPAPDPTAPDRALDLGSPALSVAVTPDGKHALVGCRDRSIRVVELATVPVVIPPLPPAEVAPPPRAVYRAPDGPRYPRASEVTRFPTFHPSGYLVAPDGVGVSVWDVTTGFRLRTFTGPADRVMAAQVTPDGKTVIGLSNERRVFGWDWATGKKHAEFAVPTCRDPLALAVFAGGAKFAIPGAGGAVSVRAWPGGKETDTIELGAQEYVFALAASADGKWLGVTSYAGRAWLWNTADKKLTGFPTAIGTGPTFTSCAFSADGRRFAVGSSGALRVWDIADPKAAPLVIATNATGLVAFGPGDRTITTAPVQPADGVLTVSRWDARTGAPDRSDTFTLVQEWSHCALAPGGGVFVDVEARRGFVLVGRPALAPPPRVKPGVETPGYSR